MNSSLKRVTSLTGTLHTSIRPRPPTLQSGQGSLVPALRTNPPRIPTRLPATPQVRIFPLKRVFGAPEAGYKLGDALPSSRPLTVTVAPGPGLPWSARETDPRRREHLVQLERIAAHLPVAAPAFDVVRWEATLRGANYPEPALSALLLLMRTGASIDPAPGNAIGEPSFQPNRGSLHIDTSVMEVTLRDALEAGTVVPWPGGQDTPQPYVVAPFSVVTKFENFADEELHKAWWKQHKRHYNALAERDARPLLRPDAPPGPPPPPDPPRPVFSGKIKSRLVHDATTGINDRGDPPKMGEYDTLRQIAGSLRPGSFIGVEDVKGAFKLVHIATWCFIVMGIAFAGSIYIDSRLTFGLNMSPLLYEALVGHPSQWLALWLAHELGLGGLLFRYVDDNITVSPPGSRTSALRFHSCLCLALELLGIPRAVNKSVKPCHRALVLGIILHTVPYVGMEVPMQKLSKIRAILSRARAREFICRKELESVIGQICYIAIAVRGAHVFSSELMFALRTARQEKITMSHGLRQDIAFWADFASTWSGRELLHKEPSIPLGHAESDAFLEGTTGGIGIHVLGRAFHIPVDISDWPADCLTGQSQHKIIGRLELIGSALLFTLLAALFPGKHIPTVRDNQNVYSWLSKGRTKKSTTNAILRFIWRISAASGTEFSTVWHPSAEMTLADPVSRNDLARYKLGLAAYNHSHLSSPRRPVWWPVSVGYTVGGRSGTITCCDKSSPLGALATYLGTNDTSHVPHVHAQMGPLLAGLRLSLAEPEPSAH